MKTAYVLFAVLLLMAAGCAKSAKDTPKVGQKWEPTMVNPPVREFPVCAPKTLAEMDDDDVIVAVNGVTLTKADFGLAVKRYWWNLEQDKAGHMKNKEAAYKRFGRGYIRNFIGTQIFVQEARKLRLLNEQTLRQYVEQGVENAARRYRCSPKVLGGHIPGGLNGLRRSMEDAVWSSTYIASNVPPRVTVSDAMVSNVLQEIQAENAGIAATNAARLAQVKALHRRVVQGGEDFGKIVDEYGMDDDVEKGKGGYWDNYNTAMDIPEQIQKKVIPLPKGGVTDVLEDDEGFYFIKVLDKRKMDGVTNDTAEVIYEYDLGRLFMPREESVVIAVKGDLKTEFQRQFQDEANDKRLVELKKTAQIVYPYGTNFWGKASTDRKNKASKAKRKGDKTLKEAKKVKKLMQKGLKPKDVQKRIKKDFKKTEAVGTDGKKEVAK